MARLNKTGMYSWEVKRLGMLPTPGGGMIIGQSPTSPIMAPQIAPSAGPSIASLLQQLTAASGSAASDVDASSVAAMQDYARYFPSAMLSDHVGSIRKLRMIAAVLPTLHADSRNIMDQIAALLAPLNEWERWMLAGRFTYKGTSRQSPDPCPTAARCHTSVELLLADLSAHTFGQVSGMTVTTSMPSVAPTGYSPGPSRANITWTSGGMTSPTPPAVAVIDRGGSGPDAAAAQTQTVLDDNNGSGITPIIPATGPSDSIPGYGVNPVLQEPSSSFVSGLPSWWKPALAIAIGAAVGVGVGRAIAR